MRTHADCVHACMMLVIMHAFQNATTQLLASAHCMHAHVHTTNTAGWVLA